MVDLSKLKRAGCLAFVLLAGLGLFAEPRMGRAQGAPIEACAEIVGTYVTIITDIENVFASRGLITLSADGNFFVNDSGQGGIPQVFDPFSTGQGNWRCSVGQGGGLEIEAIALTFTLPEQGKPGSFGRVDYKAVFDRAAQEISGSIALRFTEDDLEAADPVNRPGPVFEEFPFLGTRVVVPK